MTSVPLADRKVMDSVIDGLFNKALGRDLNPRLERRLNELGIDLKKLLPMYEHAVWVKALTAAAEELLPGVPLPKAFEQLGARVVTGYFETFIGRALKQLLKAIGVRRTLGRMSQNFAATNNYSKSEIKDVGERHVELWLNELTLTQHNTVGILKTGLELIGGKNLQVEIMRSDEQGCTYSVKWD